MADELGIFSAANPVTSGPAQAIGATLNTPPGDPGSACAKYTFYPADPGVTKGKDRFGNEADTPNQVADLPPELQKRGFIRAIDCMRKVGYKYQTQGERTVCGYYLTGYNPWVDCRTRRVLIRLADGSPALADLPCMTQKWVGNYGVFDLDGNQVCTIYAPGQGPPPDPKLPYNKIGAGFTAGTATPVGLSQVGGGGGGGGFTIAGLSVGDIFNAITGQGQNVDLSGVIAALALLIAAGGNIGDQLRTVAGGLGKDLPGGFDSLASALDAIVPGVGGRLVNALDQHATTTGDAAREAAANTAAAIVPVVGPAFAALVEQGPTLLAKLSEAYKHGVDALIAAMLDLFRDDIEAHAPVTPDTVDKVAAAALRAALTAGSVAQLSGMALELLHPLKNLGVQQAIGVLATFAGFEEIARPYFGATLRYGIGLPAEHRAAAHFRSVLPPLEFARELAAAGIMGLDKYRERLVLAGFPDPYPAALEGIVYTPPNARFTAQLLDGSESDRPWLARVYRRLGFSPEDTDRAVRAAELKTTQPGRGRVVSALLAEYKAGHVGDDELQDGLTGAGLSPTHRDYYVRAAKLERRGDRMDKIAAEVVNQYTNDVVGAATATQLLVALGMTPDEVTVRLNVADLKRNQKQVSDEVKAAETEIRTVKAAALKSATRGLRAGFLSLDQFLTGGVGMGYSRAYLQNVAAVALDQGPPKTTGAEAAIGTGALQEANARIAALVAQEVQAKQTDRVAALVTLRALGLPDDLASDVVQLAEAIAGPSPLGGDFGFRTGSSVAGSFEGIAAAVLGGLQGATSPGDILTRVLELLHLPVRDRTTLVRLIQDLRDLFHR